MTVFAASAGSDVVGTYSLATAQRVDFFLQIKECYNLSNSC